MGGWGTWIWRQSNACSDCLSECSDLTHMKFPNCSVHFIHTLSCLAHLRISTEFHSFYRGHTTFGLDWKNLYFSTVCSPKVKFQHFESFCTFFPYLKTKFNAHMLFFQEYHFLDTPKSQMGQHILVLNKILLNNHTCYSPILCRKWLCRLQCPTVVTSHCQWSHSEFLIHTFYFYIFSTK